MQSRCPQPHVHTISYIYSAFNKTATQGGHSIPIMKVSRQLVIKSLAAGTAAAWAHL